ncbi:hypothetical protein E2C01_081165 [Portunus trituberculatus]|uniref:Uncharacterized protein n=1 Tax=Portunus trituberculatus TaxID=210409 RepID=A0A5B7IR79_PORTR|nr:hypothetical protein [Portunus trituberculatus]
MVVSTSRERSGRRNGALFPYCPSASKTPVATHQHPEGPRQEVPRMLMYKIHNIELGKQLGREEVVGSCGMVEVEEEELRVEKMR